MVAMLDWRVSDCFPGEQVGTRRLTHRLFVLHHCGVWEIFSLRLLREFVLLFSRFLSLRIINYRMV
jgi:hypothetical protein